MTGSPCIFRSTRRRYHEQPNLMLSKRGRLGGRTRASRDQQIDPLANVVPVVMVRSTADEVSIDDARRIDVDAAANFQVELAFGHGRHATAADAIGVGRYFDAVANRADWLTRFEKMPRNPHEILVVADVLG